MRVWADYTEGESQVERYAECRHAQGIRACTDELMQSVDFKTDGFPSDKMVSVKVDRLLLADAGGRK